MLDTFTNKDRHKTVAFMSALVSIGIIDIEEFASVMIGVKEAYVEEDNVSENFLIVLTDWYMSRQ